MTTGDRIRAIRKEKGMTQKQLGQACGIAETTIRKYELGKLNPKYETLQKIAEALETTVEVLKGIPPLPTKKEPIFDWWPEEVEINDAWQVHRAFMAFIEGLGYDARIVFSSVKKPKEPGGSIWAIRDVRDKKRYYSSKDDMQKLQDSVVSFAQYTINNLLSQLPQNLPDGFPFDPFDDPTTITVKIKKAPTPSDDEE